MPPAPSPDAGPGDGTGSVTFAISKFYLGDTDPDGTPDHQNGWKQYGYDIDGEISTSSSNDLCKPAGNASPQAVYPDGNGGIDNAFGKSILPILLSLDSTAPVKLNRAIADGQFTLLLDMQKLGTGSDYSPLLTNAFNGGDLGAAPVFDGTDAWPVLSDLLNDGATIASGSKVSFSNSYLTQNTWVSRDSGDIHLEIPLGYSTMIFPIHRAILTVQLDPTHQHGARGVISGVMDPHAVAEQFRNAIGAIDASQCSGPTIDSVTSQILQSADIMQDGTQDPSKFCDGISIGVGFDAELVQLGAVQSPPSPPPGCPTDGGAQD